MIVTPAEHQLPTKSRYWTWFILSELFEAVNNIRGANNLPLLKDVWELVDGFIHITKRPHSGPGISFLLWITKHPDHYEPHDTISLASITEEEREKWPWDFSVIYVPTCWGKKVLTATGMGLVKVELEEKCYLPIEAENKKAGTFHKYLTNFPVFKTARGEPRIYEQLLI